MLPALLTDTITPNLDRALHYALLWGVEGVELRTVGGPSDRVPHVQEARLVRRLEEDDMPVVAISPGLFEGEAARRAEWLNEVAMLGETFRFCRRIGAPVVVVSGFAAAPDGAEDGVHASAVEALRRAGDAAGRAGLHLAVLNEIGMAHPTGAALAALLDAVDHEHVGAAWDPAAAALAGETPHEGLAAVAARVRHVRCADVDAEGEYVAFDEGRVDWAAQASALRRAGYDGAMSLEVHVHPRPKQGVRDAAALIAVLRAAQKA